MTLLSTVSPSNASLNPTTTQTWPKPVMCTGCPTRKPCAFQSNGCEREMSMPVAVGVTMTEPVSLTGSSGSSVPWMSSRSLPIPLKKFRTSIVLFAPFVWNVPSTNWTLPKPMPPGKIAGSPKVCGLPLE